MNAELHRAKAERIERSLARLSAADHEMVIEACMLAGTHWLNLLLHRSGVLPPERDAMHAEFMTVAERRKATLHLRAALEALDAIEAMRTTHVRGDLPDGEDAARRALACLAVLRGQANDAAPATR